MNSNFLVLCFLMCFVDTKQGRSSPKDYLGHLLHKLRNDHLIYNSGAGSRHEFFDPMFADSHIKVSKHVNRDAESLFSTGEVNPSAGCACRNNTCGCCAKLDFEVFEYDHTGCVNVTYLPAPEYGIQVTFTFDNTTIINKTVSVRNPPPICFNVPYLKPFLSLCIDFYNINFTSTSLAGCVKVQLRAFLVVTEELKIGCFHIGPKVTSGDRKLKWQPSSHRQQWGRQGGQNLRLVAGQREKWKL